ncbi:hypothetical protein YSY43_33210 [Paenibacillus sp. YSY-4.3]
MNRIKISWRHKLIYTSLLCLMLPSIISLALTGIHTKDEFKRKAILNAEQSLEVSDLYIANIVSDMISVTNSIQYSSEIITQLRSAWMQYNEEGYNSIDLSTFRKITENLGDFTYIRDKTYLTILMPNGLYFTNYPTHNIDFSTIYHANWLQKMADDPINTTRFIAPQPNYVVSEAGKHPNVITVARTFQLYAHSPNSYIIISKPEEQFHQILSKYASDQTILLKDSAGKIISHTDLEQLGRPAPEAHSAGGQAVVNWNGTEYLSVDHPLAYAGWSLQSLIDSRKVTGNIGSFINYLFLLQMLFVIIFSIVMYYLLRQFTYPIIRLARTSGRVQGGDLNVRSKVEGTDEIGQLGVSFDRMLDRIEEMVRQIEWEQNRKRIAELELLQAQINPHFLFNILNSIRLQVMMKGEGEIAKIIESLSTLLRMTINRNNEFIPLHEEVATVEHYMKLMNYRHMDKVELKISLASNTLLETIPRFTLQPLIENAYIHGLEQKSGEISISSWKTETKLFICVQDNGKGMTEEQLEAVMNLFQSKGKIEGETRVNQHISGIGLRNVHERIKMIYGTACSMELQSLSGEGVKITLTLPFTENKENHAHV